MPRQPSLSEIRLNNIMDGLRPIVELLTELNDAFGLPFIPAIVNTTLSLLISIQNVKKNQNECIELLERVYQLICAIVDLHIKSDMTGNLSPETLNHIGKFTQTLHKIYTFVEAHQGGSRLKRFLQKNEMNTLLKDCNVGLQEAMDVFKVEDDPIQVNTVHEMRQKTETMHKELMQLISTVPDSSTSDGVSFVYEQLSGSKNSSNSFSLLPSKPKIFHGRDAELYEIVTTFKTECVRIAILGGGGMGKTTLAKSVLHHPEVAAKYEHRIFVAVDSTSTSVDLAALIGSNLGLKPGKDLTKAVVRFFEKNPLCLLVLDNLETSWEPVESRAGVEDFLSQLSSVVDLALLITMRGVERPSNIRWSRPFLRPLRPLSIDAARQTFFDIAEDFHNPDEIDALLKLTDNMPLAVDLMAHLVDSEGCQTVLQRWETEKTSLLSDGHDRKSSLDASISVSLSSPRLTSGAKILLSLLSILPDGISDFELMQYNLPIQKVSSCKSVLLSTSLGYLDTHERLKLLVPIQEHIRCFCPPSNDLVITVFRYLHSMLGLYIKYRGADSKQIMGQIDSNRGNIQQILATGLNRDNPYLDEMIYCTLSFHSFQRMTGRGHFALMDQIPSVLTQQCNLQLKANYITEVIKSSSVYPISDPEGLVAQGVNHFEELYNGDLESSFYNACGGYYADHEDDIPKALQFLQKALNIASTSEDTDQQSLTLTSMSLLDCKLGNYADGTRRARNAQTLAHLSGNLYLEARALHPQGLCCLFLGDFGSSLHLFQNARHLLKLCGLSGGSLDRELMHLEGDIHIKKSEYPEARKIHMEIVQTALQDAAQFEYAVALINLAEIDIIIGADQHSLQSNLEKAESILRELGSWPWLAFIEIFQGDLSLREGNLSTAKALLHKIFVSSWGKHTEAVIYSLDRLADVSRWGATKPTCALTWTATYLVYAHKLQHKLAFHRALQFFGDIFLLNGDNNTAKNLFTVALEGFTFMDVHRSRAQCMMRLGDLARDRRDFTAARTLWTEALPLFRQSLQTKEVAKIDLRVEALGGK